MVLQKLAPQKKYLKSISKAKTQEKIMSKAKEVLSSFKEATDTDVEVNVDMNMITGLEISPVKGSKPYCSVNLTKTELREIVSGKSVRSSATFGY